MGLESDRRKLLCLNRMNNESSSNYFEEEKDEGVVVGMGLEVGVL